MGSYEDVDCFNFYRKIVVKGKEGWSKDLDANLFLSWKKNFDQLFTSKCGMLKVGNG